MWGQQQTGWGWPPPTMNYQYSNQEVDPSQTWAAAAALWAQQRQLQEQYQNRNGTSASMSDHPEPPGPPPARPPVPLEVSSLTSVKNIEVRDYMHGKGAIQTSEIVDYQHGKVAETVLPDADVIDYNHGKPELDNQEWEINSDSWHSHQPPQQFMNGNWYEEGWNNKHWNNEQINFFSTTQHIPDAGSPPYSSDQNEICYSTQDKQKSGSSLSDYNIGKHTKDEKQSTFPIINTKPLSNIPPKMSDLAPVIDSSEVSKRAKVLPLWLRQELEKLDKKKKNLGKSKEKEESVSAGKEKAQYIPLPTPTSPRSQDNVDPECPGGIDSHLKSGKINLRKNRSPKREKSSDLESADESSDEEINEEEQYKQMMLKVKTWMTEILLGVTNAEIKAVCKQVYVEIKRSVKAKGTQLRKSGGLDALRSAGLGVDGDATTSESDAEEEKSGSPELKISFKQNNEILVKKLESKAVEEDHLREERFSCDDSDQSDNQLRYYKKYGNEVSQNVKSSLRHFRGNAMVDGNPSKIAKRKFRENKLPASSGFQASLSNIHSPLMQDQSLQLCLEKSKSEKELQSTHRIISPENEHNPSIHNRFSSNTVPSVYSTIEERASKLTKKKGSYKYSKEDSDKETHHRYKKDIFERRKSNRMSSSSTDDYYDNASEESESDSSSDSAVSSSSDSEDIHQKKIKHYQIHSGSRSRRNKESKHYIKSSSSESERRKKKRKDRSSSLEDYNRSYRHKKKSSSEKYKHRMSSDSSSSPHIRSKRKR